MGGGLSTQQKSHAKELYKILRQSGWDGATKRDIEGLVGEICCQCYWYPEAGSLKLEDWIKAGSALFSEPRADVEYLLLWEKCKQALEKLQVPPSLSLIDQTPKLAAYPKLVSPELVPPLTPEPVPPYESLRETPPPASVPGEFKETPALRVSSLGTVRAGLQEAQKQGLIESEDLSSSMSIFPVTFGQDPMGNAQANWQPLPYQVLRELRRVIMESGLRSSFTVGMLEGIANGYQMLPQDWKDLGRMILTPSQYVVWDSEYRREAIQLGAASGGAYTADQLYGACAPAVLS